MALVICSVCQMNTLAGERCQYCGRPLKKSIWKRKMRRKEAYGILLFLTGLALLQVNLWLGLGLAFPGLALIGLSLFVPRVP